MIGLGVQRVGLLAALLLPLMGAVGARWRQGRPALCGLSWVGAASALVVALLVAAGGPATLPVIGPFGLVANPVSVLVLVLVVTVGALVQSFSARYLLGDPQSGRFAARVGVVVAGMGLVAVSADLAGLVIGWLVAGLGFTAVLTCRSDLPGVAACVRAVRRSLLVGDASLLGAAVVVWVRAGDVTLGSLASLSAAVARLGPWHALVAVLVAVAALARCGQGVFRRWLPLTVSAPTPACALLHAGFVNGGGVLLVRLGVVGVWGPAMAGLLAVSVATAVWAGLLISRQPDVKGQLASSTMSQMGFMLAECAVGAYPAALVHLFGHGCYKASLFFSSGSAIPRPGRLAPPDGAAVRPRRLLGPAVALAAAAAVVPGVALGDGGVLTVFAAVTAGSLAWESRPAADGRGGWRWAALMVAASAGYGTAVAGLGRFLDHGLPAAQGTIGQWWLASLAVAAVAASWLTTRSRFAIRLQVRLLDAGTAPTGWQDFRRLPDRPGVPTPTVLSPAFEASAA